MNKLKSERFLLIFICLLTVAGLLWPALSNNITWDYHLHDTYYVVNTLSIVVYSLFYCCLLFGLYTIIRGRHKGVNAFVGLFHIVATIGFIVFILWGDFFVDNSPTPRRYLDYSGLASYSYISLYEKISFVLLLLFLVAQLVFFVYFFTRLFSHRKMQTL
jgi:cytochrome c oxidase subunit 1